MSEAAVAAVEALPDVDAMPDSPPKEAAVEGQAETAAALCRRRVQRRRAQFSICDRHVLESVRLSAQKSFALAVAIHNAGRGIVWSGTRELAELKRDQIRSCGPDFHATAKVTFPLGVTIEPLPG